MSSSVKLVSKLHKSVHLFVSVVDVVPIKALKRAAPQSFPPDYTPHCLSLWVAVVETAGLT